LLALAAPGGSLAVRRFYRIKVNSRSLSELCDRNSPTRVREFGENALPLPGPPLGGSLG